MHHVLILGETDGIRQEVAEIYLADVARGITNHIELAATGADLAVERINYRRLEDEVDAVEVEQRPVDLA